MSSGEVAYYWYWNKEIPHETCQKIISLGEGNWDQAQTFGSQEKNKPLDKIRKSDIVWINDQWVFDIIWPYMLSANEQAGWNYNIVAAAACQVTRYTKDGFYSWHKDGIGSHNELHNDNARKLSMTLVLNDDYEGGGFEVRIGNLKKKKLREGSIIFFPSFVEHRIAPITEGIRYSLVAWFVGPPFV